MPNVITPSRSPAAIDPVQPVDWGDALNAGLKLWMLATPQRSGGKQWRDLTGHYTGALTNMDPASDWVATDRGLGLDIVRANQSVIFDRPLDFSGDLAVAAWVYLRNNTSQQVFVGNYGGGGAAQHFQLAYYFTAPQRLFFFVDNGTYWCAAQSLTASPTTNQWFHLLGTYSANDRKARFYENGVLQEESSALVGADPDWTERAVQIGEAPTGSYDADCIIDDVRIWNRAPSADEVVHIYHDSRSGYLRTLNRRLRWFPAAVSEATSARTRLVGSGIL
jgi:hypothetical protein